MANILALSYIEYQQNTDGQWVQVFGSDQDRIWNDGDSGLFLNGQLIMPSISDPITIGEELTNNVTFTSFLYAGLYPSEGEIFYLLEGFPLAGNAGTYVLLSTKDLSDVEFPVEIFPDTAQIIALDCFAPGTRIATPTGETPVEALAIGDTILTADGRGVPVKWIGRQTVLTRFGLAERLTPVRVRAGALGDGVPQRDLVLTADHALLIDGLLVNAGALVNGGSVDWVPLAELGESFTVYHIETEDHDIILAEGAPAETLIDYAGRRVFDNYAEYVALYGEDRVFAENPAPRISSARMLPAALKRRLGIEAAA